MEMAEGEGTTAENYDVDIATTASSVGGSGVFHIINDIVGFVLYMHQQIPLVVQDMSLEFDELQFVCWLHLCRVVQDMSLEFDELQTEFMDLEEANLTQPEVKPLVRRKLVSRKREVKNEIKKLEKLMKTITSLRSALQLMMREAPGIQKVVLILGGSPLRPQKAYELLFTQHSDHVLSYEGDFAKSKAAEALSKKTIRALISVGDGSTSYPGPMRLFILVHAPPTLNLPQHFLPKRDFRFNRKFAPSKLRFIKCRRTQANATNSPLKSSTTDDLIWFQCRHVIKGLAFHEPVQE